MNRVVAPSVLAIVVLLCTLLALGVSHTSPVARGQEQTSSPTTVPSAAVSATPGPTAAAPATVTTRISAYNDASVASGGAYSPDTNLGGWSDLAVGQQQGGTYRDYLRFVLAGLPPGIQIDSAQLFLTPLQTGSQPVTITADVVQEDWNEASITWDQQPLTTWQAGAATWQPGQAGPFAIDLTQAARTWYACGGTTDDGIQLSADRSGDSVVFASRKSAYPPVLAVTYEATNAPLDCTAAPAAGGSQAPSQPGPSTSGAQIGAVPISTPPPGTINPGTLPCPTVFCVSRGSDVTNNSGTVGGAPSSGGTAGGFTNGAATSTGAAGGGAKGTATAGGG